MKHPLLLAMSLVATVVACPIAEAGFMVDAQISNGGNVTVSWSLPETSGPGPDWTPGTARYSVEIEGRGRSVNLNHLSSLREGSKTFFNVFVPLGGIRPDTSTIEWKLVARITQGFSRTIMPEPGIEITQFASIRDGISAFPETLIVMKEEMPTPVPEASTVASWCLMGLTGVGLAWFRKRKR